MPKSKRNKIVALTQTKKKTSEHKKNLLIDLEQLIESSKFVFIFDLNETKASEIMKLRIGLKDIGRIYAGKNKIAALAFKNKSTNKEIVPKLNGKRGLLFTDVEHSTLVERLDSEYKLFSGKLLDFCEITKA